MTTTESYRQILWGQIKKNKIGVAALFILGVFFLVGLYAPILASSKPLLVLWNNKLYFPLFRYLFYPGFYTKPIDLFFNLMMFTLPVTLLGLCFVKKGKQLFVISMILIHLSLFGWILSGAVRDPSSQPTLQTARKEAVDNHKPFREDPLLTPFASHPTWHFEQQYRTPYEKLNQLLSYKQRQAQQQRLSTYQERYEKEQGREMPTLWTVYERNEAKKIELLRASLEETQERYIEAIDTLPELIAAYRPFSHSFIMAKYDFEHATDQNREEAERKYLAMLKEASPFRAPLANARHVIEKHQQVQASLAYLQDKNKWLTEEGDNFKILIPALLRPFHWQDDAGGAQSMNKYVPWWELTRINRKDLAASLLFGIRISIVVGFTAVFLSLLIGIPLGIFAGYFAGKSDLVICRILEIWEAMPTFFMLLLVVAITQSKSIFLVIAVLGIFGWTGFGRFIRAETLKQRGLSYVLACKSLGYNHGRIMFSHILPNAIPPILTLIPFSMMAAIVSEAGLSFLGLGEEGSTSWGVLMDEGRSVFPSESYLLWPPAILLTLLLISIALFGDAMRDALDPKMRQ